MKNYTHNDCERALHLVQEEVHSRCCTDEADCIQGAPPSRCGYDCAHIWYPFSQDCADFLDSDYPNTFTAFTEKCDSTHARMQVLSERGTVSVGGPAFNTTFAALRDVEYRVEMVPDDADELRRALHPAQVERATAPRALTSARGAVADRTGKAGRHALGLTQGGLVHHLAQVVEPALDAKSTSAVHATHALGFSAMLP